MSPHKGMWGQSSNLSSVPLLSPSELAGASEGKVGNNDPIQALLLAQMRQRLQQQEQGQHQQQLQLESYMQPKKRARLLMDSSNSSSKGLESGNLYLSGGMSSSPLEAELGQNSYLGGLSPSLLNNALSGNGGGNGSGNNNMTQIQQLLRKQQLQELQQLQQLKQREDMQRLSQLQSRDAVLQIMLQQQQQQQHHHLQQQQQQALSLESMNGNASLVAQLKALQDQQDQHQHNSNHSKASSSDETAVANYMRKNNHNGFGGGSQQNNVLQQMQALAKFEQQNNDGMPPPPPMVSAVSSLDSVAIMSMLLPQNQQQQQKLQQASSNAAASRLLGTDFSLGGSNGGLGNNSNLNNSLLAPMPFPPPSLGNLGMGSSAASLFGSLGGLSGNNGLSSMMGRAGSNLISSGPVGNGLALHPSAADVIYEQRRLAAAAEVSNTVRDSSVGKPPDAFVDRDPDGRARDLPTLLVVPMDHMQLSSHQTLLRYQIEVFRAGEEDTSTHTRGRNKPVQLGQIGIRCRHCKVLPVSRRKRGSVYFPRAVEGFYQAAQNMNSTHLQTGECPLMGNALRQEFANLIATRGVSTGAGRAYWAKQARKLGLRNTDTGIVFDKKDAVCIPVPSNGSSSPSDSSKKTE